MNLPDHIQRRIRDAIARGGGSLIDEEARNHRAIALMGTVGAIWMLRADGTLWEADADFGMPLTPLPEARHVAALALGAKRFPWLAELLPPRPPGATDCATCGGRGVVFPSNIVPVHSDYPCPDCATLGWRGPAE